MFKFLKEKLKSAISKISEGVEKEGKIEETIIEKPAEEAKGFFARIKEKFVGKEVEEKKKDDSKILKEPVESKPKADISDKKLEIMAEKMEEPRLEPQIVKEVIKKHPEIFGKDFPEMLQKAEAAHTDKKFEEEANKKFQESYKKLKETKKTEPKEEKITEPEKKGFFAAIKEKIITTKIDNGQFEKLFWDLEMALMENNVAVEVIERIKNDLKEELVEKPIRRTRVEETIQETLKGSIEGLFKTGSIDLMQEIKNKREKPYVVAFFGINGSGKTTSIAKIAKMLKDNKISCVLAASDTFRAASIEQLQHHAGKVGVSIIKHNYGADPAAVAFDAIKHAKAKGIDAVLIDTAGRMHSNQNLIDELKKITKVTRPDLKIFVGESIAGNDCIEQAKTFNEAVGIDGIILAKADIDEKGGAAVSVSYVTKKPILYLGTGQKYGDLQPFDAKMIIKNLELA